MASENKIVATVEPQDWIQAAVQRVHNPPEGWAWCRSEVVGERPNDAFLIEGGIPRVITRGPRRGHRTWKGSVLTQYVITRAQLDEEKTR